MSNRIQLLPDHIANQIAAGEVIQRPASLVKELLENSIDAGANHIQLIVKNAGKTLVQIIDNGSGMSETDARMCFEKHATSKIRSADDLFNIRTMGFRGEALASVAAIAQVEMKTKLHDQSLGTVIEIEGMKVLRQEPCQTPPGTSIAVKNLFFNVPARRNFLKTENAELRHIFDEFNRVALAYPNVSMELFSNDNKVFHYKAGNLKQRVCTVFDTKYESKLVPVSEQPEGMGVSGFVGKPELAKKTRGEQFLFVNKRFIKSPYIHHAVMNAFDQLLPKESFPFYVLFIDVNPQWIDVNVHPQKYEVKFEDERMVYTFVNLAVKHALGAYAVMPSIDFNQEDALNKNGTFEQSPNWLIQQGATSLNQSKRIAHDFNDTFAQNQQKPTSNWETLFETKVSRAWNENEKQSPAQEQLFEEIIHEESQIFQLQKRYVLSPIRSGFILIDQQAAHERILFEQYIKSMAHNSKASQRQLFPVTIEYSEADTALFEEIISDIQSLGFDVQPFGQNTFVVHALPADLTIHNEKKLFEEMIEEFKNNLSISKLSKRENLAKSLAVSTSIKHGQSLSKQEMKALTDELFACEFPTVAPNGRHTYITITFDELASRFKNQ